MNLEQPSTRLVIYGKAKRFSFSVQLCVVDFFFHSYFSRLSLWHWKASLLWRREALSEFLMRESRAKVKVLDEDDTVRHESEGLTTPFDYGEAVKSLKTFYWSIKGIYVASTWIDNRDISWACKSNDRESALKMLNLQLRSSVVSEGGEPRERWMLIIHSSDSFTRRVFVFFLRGTKKTTRRLQSCACFFLSA